MSYKKENLKNGVCLHTIKTNKFKTNLFSVMLTTPINREDVTKNALISLLLRRGTMTYTSQDEISKQLENMYGASFNCGVDKIGDNQVIKFYLESLNDEFLPEKDNNFEKSIEILFDIVFNPLTDNGKFKQDYFEAEKQKLKQIIESQKDNKGMYSFNRCIEEMYKGKPFGIYKYGYVEDINSIKNEELYSRYKELISTCKIDIFVSGDIEDSAKSIIENNKNITKLEERKINFIIDSIERDIPNKEKIIQESDNITQGKLVIGMNLEEKDENSKNVALLYNGILGGTANSKLFQNVREKASLAYTAGSNYIKQKANIVIRCGIEIENYEKALEIIRQQIEDMKNGIFSDEDIENTKRYIVSTIEGIEDEQDSEITYYFGQELSNTNISIEEYIKNIKNVTKQQIVDIADTIKINTIYFLKN